MGSPGRVAKSSISLFHRNPRPGATRALPKESLSVVVIDTAIPEPSTTEKCVVVGLSPGKDERAAVGVEWRGLIEATSDCRRGRFRNRLWRTPAKAGSPSQRLRS